MSKSASASGEPAELRLHAGDAARWRAEGAYVFVPEVDARSTSPTLGLGDMDAQFPVGPF